MIFRVLWDLMMLFNWQATVAYSASLLILLIQSYVYQNQQHGEVFCCLATLSILHTRCMLFLKEKAKAINEELTPGLISESKN